MLTYIIAYDLKREIVRPNITGAIKQRYNWAMLSESCYAIETADSPSEIFGRLRPLIDPDDQIYVIPIKKPYAGFGPPAINNWLDTKLGW